MEGSRAVLSVFKSQSAWYSTAFLHLIFLTSQVFEEYQEPGLVFPPEPFAVFCVLLPELFLPGEAAGFFTGRLAPFAAGIEEDLATGLAVGLAVGLAAGLATGFLTGLETGLLVAFSVFLVELEEEPVFSLASV